LSSITVWGVRGGLGWGFPLAAFARGGFGRTASFPCAAQHIASSQRAQAPHAFATDPESATDVRATALQEHRLDHGRLKAQQS
jgi:hypothetical protein